MNNPQSQQLLRLTLLLRLESRARAAREDELDFLMVNETLGVVRYRQAVLWRSGPGARVLAISGVTMPDANAPYVVWLTRLCRALDAEAATDMRELTAADVPGELGEQWDEWLPQHLVRVPLEPGPGALLLAREEPLGDGDRQLLGILADAYGHAWGAQRARRRFGDGPSSLVKRRRWIIGALALGVVAAGFIPVRQSALAPAEISAREPAVIRAPLEGVVDNVLVRPNEQVVDGQTLFNLDPRRLRNQLAVAVGAMEAVDAELRQARQQAVVDQKVRASLPVLQGKYDQQAAEIAYLREQLERVEVKAPKGGLAVFDDPNEWLGRPVVIGERVMLVADPDKVEIEARLAVSDAIDLEPGAPVRLFLNIDPERPRDGVLTLAAYQAQPGPDGVLAYRVKARLGDGEVPPRIGLKGTAKLYGARVPLAYAVLRRPLAAARQWLGF